MQPSLRAEINEAKAAALEVLRHNAHGPYHGLPRAAAWGYPEPYTRDVMISALGILTSGDDELLGVLRDFFLELARNQSPRGHIPSLAHDPGNRGASDTTPLFLLALGMYRRATGEHHFLEEAAQRALTWMEYQSPSDDVPVGQLPTSDWRDEQWVLGYGLFVNTVVYSYLRLFGMDDRASALRQYSAHLLAGGEAGPYYALWKYKVLGSDRFDLLGNSLAIISGLASQTRARRIITWVEDACRTLRANGDLVGELPPNFFPFIRPGDDDWHPRYAMHNPPGHYHNGGIWPFVASFYVVAVLAAGMPLLAEEKLAALTALNRQAQDPSLAFGFNEWIRAQDGTLQGHDWQTWSAAMYYYAARCVEERRVLLFDEVRAGEKAA